MLGLYIVMFIAFAAVSIFAQRRHRRMLVELSLLCDSNDRLAWEKVSLVLELKSANGRILALTRQADALKKDLEGKYPKNAGKDSVELAEGLALHWVGGQYTLFFKAPGTAYKGEIYFDSKHGSRFSNRYAPSTGLEWARATLPEAEEK